MDERLNEQRKERVSAGMNERKERTRKNHSRICQDTSSKNGICREESKVSMHSTLKWWSVRKKPYPRHTRSGLQRKCAGCKRTYALTNMP